MEDKFNKDVDRLVNRIWDINLFLSRKSMRLASYGSYREMIKELRIILDELEEVLSGERIFADNDPMKKYYSDKRISNEQYYGEVHIPSNQKAGKQG